MVKLLSKAKAAKAEKRAKEALAGGRGRKAKRKAERAVAGVAKPKKNKEKYNNKSPAEKRAAKAEKKKKGAGAEAGGEAIKKTADVADGMETDANGGAAAVSSFLASPPVVVAEKPSKKAKSSSDDNSSDTKSKKKSKKAADGDDNDALPPTPQQPPAPKRSRALEEPQAAAAAAPAAADANGVVAVKEKKEKKEKKDKAAPPPSSPRASAAKPAAAAAAAAAAAPAAPAAAAANNNNNSSNKNPSHDGKGGEAASGEGKSVDEFRLSAPTRAALRARGISTLFPIQAATLDLVLDGADVVGRARTGCGKTLAFVLPIVERLAGVAAEGGNSNPPQRRAHGRAPRCIVLAPTRELAKQVAADFETIGGAHGLSCLCLYGGAQYQPQEGALRRGVDVVIGTPGRVKDHLERGTLKLRDLRFRVLDECDEMLNMGFVDDVEKILGAAGKVHGNAPAGASAAAADASATPQQQQSIQTLLFSATLPPWVRDITRRFLDPAHKTIDLVGTSKMKASSSVRHLLLPCHWSQRSAVVCDVVRAYGAGAAAASVSTGTDGERERERVLFFLERVERREKSEREREMKKEMTRKEKKKNSLSLSHHQKPPPPPKQHRRKRHGPLHRLHRDQERRRRARRSPLRVPRSARPPRRRAAVGARGDAQGLPRGQVRRAGGDGRRGARA